MCVHISVCQFVCVSISVCVRVCVCEYLEYISALGFTTLAGLLKSGSLLVTVHPASLTRVSESHTFTWTFKPLKDNLILAQSCLGFPYRCLLPNTTQMFQRGARVYVSMRLSVFCLTALGSNTHMCNLMQKWTISSQRMYVCCGNGYENQRERGCYLIIMTWLRLASIILE